MLPEIDGLEVCRLLKQDERTKEIPLIMLTAKSEESDRVKGFELGADDYVVKPFSPNELLLRIKAVLRRSASGQADKSRLRIGKLLIDEDKAEAKVNGEIIQLTQTEFKLLLFLFRNRDKVFSREDLLSSVWEHKDFEETRTVDTHIKRLRQKLLDCGDLIKTVHGLGYRFGN
jgi:DNA-binding response OmpR family regulator